MQPETETPTATRLYYVTEDLQEIMERWCESRQLRPAPNLVFETLRDRLQSNLDDVFSVAVEDEASKTAIHIEVRYVYRKRLRTLIREENDGEFWIALDDVCVPRAEVQLDLCRLYDQDGFKIGVGSRPQGKTLEEQLHDCERAYNALAGPKPVVVLADDGTYTGDSIVEAAHALGERGIVVQRVNLGFCTNEGAARIQQSLPGIEIGASVIVDKTRHVYHWMTERDFYLGVPRSGSPYGSLQGKRPMACEIPIGLAYLEPFSASRRTGKIRRGLMAFSRSQILSSLELWKAVEEANGLRLRVSDIPRFPGPGLVPEYRRYADTLWLDYIYLVAEMMFSDLRPVENDSDLGSGKPPT